MSNITFELLTESHFALMLKWLESSHVKAWWDGDITYNVDLVKDKYLQYTKGYKIEENIKKTIKAYIINIEQRPIGYIQLYNAYDFACNYKLIDLPKNLGALDIFIGNKQYLGKNIGSRAIAVFLQDFGKEYDYVFVSTDKDNIAAMKSYQKAGFKKLTTGGNYDEVQLLWQR